MTLCTMGFESTIAIHDYRGDTPLYLRGFTPQIQANMGWNQSSHMGYYGSNLTILALDMNAFEFERKLSDRGFKAKDIIALRHYLEKGGNTYPALLKELNIRFIASVILIFILAAVWLYTFLYKDHIAILSYSITMLIVAPIFYIFTPMKLGCKAFIYMLKK